MKIIAAIVLALAAGGIAPAQEKSNQLSPLVRIYEPKYMSAGRASLVADFVTTVLGGSTVEKAVRSTEGTYVAREAKPPIRVYWDDVPHAVVIRGGSAADQDAAEALLKRFDVPESKTSAETRPPASSFEITAYLIRADSGDPPQTSGSAPAPQLMPVPKDLQGAIDEMKQTFSYRDYHLWDTIVTQPGGTVQLSGILPMKPGFISQTPDSYSLSFQRARAEDEKTLTLDGFEFVLSQPWGQQPLQSRISHGVTLHAGQKLILGKIRLIPSENADLFLVLTAKLK